MPNDIFGRNVSNLGGVFTADRAKLTLKGNLGVLVQQLQFTYQQAITRLYEVGNNNANGGGNIYYVGGRTQGQLTINRVIGPSGSVAAMYAQYGNVCNAKVNTIELTLTETDCSQAAAAGRPSNYKMQFCVITSVAIGVSAEQMIISENTTMMYSSLEAS